MKAWHVIEVSIEEAKSRLIQLCLDVINAELADLGVKLSSWIVGDNLPDLKSEMYERFVGYLRKLSNECPPEWVAELFGEENLGQQIAEENDASQVIIEVDDYTWNVVFDIRNVHPTSRWGVWKLAANQLDQAA